MKLNQKGGQRALRLEGSRRALRFQVSAHGHLWANKLRLKAHSQSADGWSVVKLEGTKLYDGTPVRTMADVDAAIDAWLDVKLRHGLSATPMKRDGRGHYVRDKDATLVAVSDNAGLRLALSNWLAIELPTGLDLAPGDRP